MITGNTLFEIYELTEKAEVRIASGMSVQESLTYLRHDICALSVQGEEL